MGHAASIVESEAEVVVAPVRIDLTSLYGGDAASSPSRAAVAPCALPVPSDVLPTIFSFASAREIGVVLWCVGRAATAQLRGTAELGATLAAAAASGWCEDPPFVFRVERKRSSSKRKGKAPSMLASGQLAALRPSIKGYRYYECGPLGCGHYSGTTREETGALGRGALHWHRGGPGGPAVDVWMTKHPASGDRERLTLACVRATHTKVLHCHFSTSESVEPEHHESQTNHIQPSQERREER